MNFHLHGAMTQNWRVDEWFLRGVRVMGNVALDDSLGKLVGLRIGNGRDQ